jgi:hypothetical protein
MANYASLAEGGVTAVTEGATISKKHSIAI